MCNVRKYAVPRLFRVAVGLQSTLYVLVLPIENVLWRIPFTVGTRQIVIAVSDGLQNIVAQLFSDFGGYRSRDTAFTYL